MKMPVDGLLLAAGFSARMGDFKPLLLYEGEPFVVGIARKMNHVCRKVVVVLGHRAGDIRQAFGESGATLTVEFVENPRFADGMFTSLQAGVAALSDSDWVLYQFTDQPHLPAGFYGEFAQQVDSQHDMIQPVHQGRRGHPLLLARPLLKAIRSAPPAANLRDVMKASGARVKVYECPFEGILSDLDTPSDLERLRNDE